MDPALERLDASIVSCDIVGHGIEPDHARQVGRIEGINAVVRHTLKRCPVGDAIWASGGDGGHVAFVRGAGVADAVDLAARLSQWAVDAGVPLRVTCHAGPVSTVVGADDRIQLVGDGINLCGSLVGFGIPGRVLATSAFREAVLAAQAQGADLPALRFVEEQVVYLKHFAAHRLSLMTFGDEAGRAWQIERSDHRQLDQALRTGHAWLAIYHIKRLLQVDSGDQQAHQALAGIDPRLLTVGSNGSPHPLLAFLPRQSLIDLLRASELVERDDGDVICQRDDTGDSMFIVLRGRIGVVLRQIEADDAARRPEDIQIGEGGMVGELALALNRPRTATLQAVGQTALLALDYEALTKLLGRVGAGSRLATSFRHFIEERVVEHLSRRCPSLQVVAAGERGDDDAWERLIDGVSRIELDADPSLRVAHGHGAMSGTGLYILASGHLREVGDNPNVPKCLSGDGFDVVFANLPGSVIATGHEYRVDDRRPPSRITIVRLAEPALAAYGGARFADLVAGIRRSLGRQMVFDAFISYTVENDALAARWKAAMEAAGLKVYMNAPAAMSRFEPEIDLALSESRVLVPIISRASLESDWVKREIGKRRELFDEGHANILPVETEHRLAEKMGVGFTSILTGRPGSEEETIAIGRAVDTIREVTAGRRPPPFRSTGPAA